ncbi:catechol 2,3-dioxygenase-like lactoylglutathione lyase family enzyme [Sphingobium sp. OAS761]|uniref:VOC family protein n=1 Tax=Sphingobium sp. OAS761 TaxID=2817901 RepID=UPI00209CB3CE|nr:VOC family protein [Sphingobium sp. OAS761]MCP1471700.1 catechol 2,3-dioxygenase-like lactoylglutathione lyase family enzyme [Sphingobium sp. OAS761]
MTAKAFSLAKIQVADIDAAERFYVEALSLEVVGRVTQGEGESLMFERIMSVPGSEHGAPNFILISFPNSPCPPPGEATIGFRVDALEPAIEKAIAAGASIDVPATDLPQYGLRLAFILDPQGHRVELLQIAKG